MPAVNQSFIYLYLYYISGTYAGVIRMPVLNIKFTDKEMSNLLKKKLAESKRQGKQLSWKEFLLAAAKLVSE